MILSSGSSSSIGKPSMRRWVVISSGDGLLHCSVPFSIAWIASLRSATSARLHYSFFNIKVDDSFASRRLGNLTCTIISVFNEVYNKIIWWNLRLPMVGSKLPFSVLRMFADITYINVVSFVVEESCFAWCCCNHVLVVEYKN